MFTNAWDKLGKHCGSSIIRLNGRWKKISTELNRFVFFYSSEINSIGRFSTSYYHRKLTENLVFVQQEAVDSLPVLKAPLTLGLVLCSYLSTAALLVKDVRSTQYN